MMMRKDASDGVESEVSSSEECDADDNAGGDAVNYLESWMYVDVESDVGGDAWK